MRKEADAFQITYEIHNKIGSIVVTAKPLSCSACATACVTNQRTKGFKCSNLGSCLASCLVLPARLSKSTWSCTLPPTVSANNCRPLNKPFISNSSCDSTFTHPQLMTLFTHGLTTPLRAAWVMPALWLLFVCISRSAQAYSDELGNSNSNNSPSGYNSPPCQGFIER